MEVVEFDGKISWIVAFACALMNGLIMIPMKLSGLFFVEIIDRFQVSRSLAGYPAFLITIVRCSGGPFVGYITERIGIHKVLIIGSILSAFGISVCFFAEDIAVVILFFGIIHGCGVAFNNTLLPMIVKVHSKKYITLAFGVTQAGSSIGTVFASPLLVWILQRYGTSGGFLITGAILLNSLPLIMIVNIFTPNRLHRKPVNSEKSKENPDENLKLAITVIKSDGEGNDMMNCIDDEREKDINATEDKVMSTIRSSIEDKVESDLILDKPNYNYEKADEIELRRLSELNMCSASMKEFENGQIIETVENRIEAIENNTKSSITKVETEVDTDRNINKDKNDFQVLIPISDIRAKSLTNSCEEEHTNNYPSSKTKIKLYADTNLKDNLKHRIGAVKDYKSNVDSNNDSFICTSGSYTADCRHSTAETKTLLPPSIDNLNARSSESMQLSSPELHQKEIINVEKQSEKESAKARNKTAKKSSLMIFLDLTFLVVVTSNCFYCCVLVIFWATMIDFSRDKNIDKSMEVYLLIASPLAELIGRLGLGWIADRKYLKAINLCVLLFIGVGCSCSLMAVAQGFYAVMASISAFGTLSSGLITMLPMLIFEFFDPDKHTMAQSSKSWLFGPLSFANGPLIGYFRGTLESYALLYHLLGVVCVFCGVLTALIPVLARRRDKNKN